jgi:hypothetical protein
LWEKFKWKKMQHNYGKKMFTLKGQADPNNQCPDKWSSTVCVCLNKLPIFRMFGARYVQILEQLIS